MPDLEGYYLTENDLKAYITAEELQRLTVEIESTETNIQRIIKDRSSWADTKLQAHYDLPIDENVYDLRAFKGHLTKLVIWDLSANYSDIGEQQRLLRQEWKNEAMEFFDGLASGIVKLTSGATDTTEEEKFYFDANLRITRDFH